MHEMGVPVVSSFCTEQCVLNVKQLLGFRNWKPKFQMITMHLWKVLQKS